MYNYKNKKSFLYIHEDDTQVLPQDIVICLSLSRQDRHEDYIFFVDFFFTCVCVFV